MSNEATSWAADQTAGSIGAKCLLLMLANHVDKAGVGYPGRTLLAQECECKPATITANMKKLEEAGLVARHERRRGNGSRTSDWVVLAPGLTDEFRVVARVDQLKFTDVHDAYGTVTSTKRIHFARPVSVERVISEDQVG